MKNKKQLKHLFDNKFLTPEVLEEIIPEESKSSFFMHYLKNSEPIVSPQRTVKGNVIQRIYSEFIIPVEKDVVIIDEEHYLFTNDIQGIIEHQNLFVASMCGKHEMDMDASNLCLLGVYAPFKFQSAALPNQIANNGGSYCSILNSSTNLDLNWYLDMFDCNTIVNVFCGENFFNKIAAITNVDLNNNTLALTKDDYSYQIHLKFILDKSFSLIGQSNAGIAIPENILNRCAFYKNLETIQTFYSANKATPDEELLVRRKFETNEIAILKDATKCIYFELF